MFFFDKNRWCFNKRRRFLIQFCFNFYCIDIEIFNNASSLILTLRTFNHLTTYGFFVSKFFFEIFRVNFKNLVTMITIKMENLHHR